MSCDETRTGRFLVGTSKDGLTDFSAVPAEPRTLEIEEETTSVVDAGFGPTCVVQVGGRSTSGTLGSCLYSHILVFWTLKLF